MALIRADGSAELTYRPWFSRADISAVDIHRYTRMRYHHVYIGSFSSHDREYNKVTSPILSTQAPTPLFTNHDLLASVLRQSLGSKNLNALRDESEFQWYRVRHSGYGGTPRGHPVHWYRPHPHRYLLFQVVPQSHHQTDNVTARRACDQLFCRVHHLCLPEFGQWSMS